MEIHKEGKKIIPIAFFFLALFDAIIYFVLRDYAAFYFIMAASLALAALTVYFFRVPFFEVPKNPSHILAPADGKIVEVLTVREKEYFNDERIQISIFMSPLDVHQNRAPVAGEVVYEKHKRGVYYPAFVKKSSEKNERNSVVFKMDDGTEIMARQIAGTVARRICSYKKPGDYVDQGKEYGFIRFGSRVDVFLPVNTRVNVDVQQRVMGGRTVLATFK